MESGFRSTDWQQLTFAVVGMGLIGGSYAKALRRLGVKKIIGVDTDGKVLRQAQEQAVIDEALCGAGPGLQAADVVICSVYPAATLDFVKSAVPFLQSDVLITDATGIKGSLPEDVQRLLTGRMEFIAGHPMAGRQGSGLGMSQAEIFDGANYIVVPAAFNSSGAIEWLSSFAGAIGCGQVVQVDAVEHDRIIAYTSNLPHALAVALINSASYNENTKYFIAVRLPYGVQADEADAQKALAFIQPDVSLVVNIKESADEMVRAVEATGTEISDFNKGNIKARSRMIAQYALAGARSGAVIGTDHAAENITGFFTKFGDGGADILPLFRLNKRQGKQLLKALGADPALYEKIPTADLEEEKPGIADEVALGVTYNEIDDYLEGKQVSPEAQATIEKWWYKGQHKRHLPITVFDHFWE